MAIDRDKILQAAQKLVEKKRYDKAIVEYKRIVAEDPRDARTLLKIGDLYLKIEDFEKAILTYEQVGEYYYFSGSALKAIAVYKQIREIILKHVPHLEDRFGYVVPKLAEIYTQLGLTTDALASYEEMALRLQQSGRDLDAINVFKKIIALEPNNPVLHLRLAEAYVRVKDVPNAIGRFGEAAEILLRTGRNDDALKVVERLLHYRPEPQFAKAAARIYLERATSSDFTAALSKLQIAFKSNPRDLETLTLLAKAFDRLNQPAKAIEVQKEAARIAKDTGQTALFESLVDELVRRAPQDEAVRQLAEARVNRSTLDVELADDDILLEEASIREGEFELELSRLSGLSYSSFGSNSAIWSRQQLEQVDVLRRHNHSDRAIQLLEQAIRIAPSNKQFREKICDILIETNHVPQALAQMFDYACFLQHTGDLQEAVRVLDELLLVDASYAPALSMLATLGYSPQTYSGSQPPPEVGTQSLTHDVESAAIEQMPSRRPTRPAPVEDTDVMENPIESEPLPQFPMEEPYSADESRPRVSSAPPPPPSMPMSVTDATLEEIEFFATHGMLHEAYGILNDQLRLRPSHRLLLEKKEELDQMMEDAGKQANVEKGYREFFESKSFDIKQSLAALDSLEIPSEEVDTRELNVDQVFAQFKAGVSASISDSDAATHYDLGLAYKEIGKFDDALREFELAARDPARECVCQSLIGMIHRQRGDLDGAIDAFLRGQHAAIQSPESETALFYELGDAYAKKGNWVESRRYFELVAQANPHYFDPRGMISDRLRDSIPPRSSRVSSII